jgi:hypothetical protein
MAASTNSVVLDQRLVRLGMACSNSATSVDGRWSA